MDWKMQLGISIVVPIISSVLTYLAAIKKSKDEIKAVQIKADTEIQKIKEESEKEIKRIKTETEEQIKLKMAERDMASKDYEEKVKIDALGSFFNGFMQDPQKGTETLRKMQDLAEMFKSKN